MMQLRKRTAQMLIRFTDAELATLREAKRDPSWTPLGTWARRVLLEAARALPKNAIAKASLAAGGKASLPRARARLASPARSARGGRFA